MDEMEAGEGPSRKKKLKRTDVDAQESDVQHQLAYLPLVYPRSTSTYIPTDTSLAIVKPSSICMDDVEAFDEEEVASDVGEWKDGYGMSPHPGTRSVHRSP
jgi:hypothetical protein